ncbi:MAG: PAS domain-containing protein, partial [Deltaproteobacteria bacterium]|nr:PAS domain-containing protein [Deltaproteobacteria bacterium]
MTDERLRKSAPDLKPRGPRRFRLEDEPTQTIDLVGLFTTDITSSGSFDVKDGIWATTFGKLLQSLPVPAFLVDERFEVVVANQACSRIYPNYESVQNSPFAELFPGTGHAAKVSELLAEVLRTRKPKVTEALLKIGNGKIWARLTFRSIRISDIRSVLVMVEDLTTEKKLLLLSRKYQQELEARVEERTAELKAVNVK